MFRNAGNAIAPEHIFHSQVSFNDCTRSQKFDPVRKQLIENRQLRLLSVIVAAILVHWNYVRKIYFKGAKFACWKHQISVSVFFRSGR